jgi:branched-chain amino acid transport system ATP-binding protein
MLKVNEIDAGYGDLKVLWNVSLQLKDREIVSVIGSNGSGKTTLLKAICGVLRPTKGTIKLFDEEITNLKPHEVAAKGVAHVMEGRRLFPYLTVEENLKMGAYLPDAWKRKNESLDLVYDLFPRLKERKNQLAGTLSGGESQMLAIARALMLKPKLLLLDEPSLGLGPKIVSSILDVIKRIKEQEQITILLVEQNIYYSLLTSSRAYVLENGRIVMEGSSDELLDNPYIKKTYLGL